MKIQIAVCAALFVGLLAWDVVATSREERERASNVRVGRLISKQEREAKSTMAVVVETNAGEKFVYTKTAPDVWRCASYKNAIASSERLERGLISKMFEAEGHVQSDTSEFAKNYGLDVPAMFKVSLHGEGYLKNPDQGDLIATIDVGKGGSDREGCYMRRHGDPRIWSMDANPHAELDRPLGMKQPPLLDPSMIPMYWLSSAQRVKVIKVERGGIEPYELEVRDKQITPEEMRQGKSPVEWFFKRGGAEQLCDQPAALSYTTFMMRAPYSDVLDASEYGKLGFDRPVAKLTLTPGQGAPLEIYVGGATPSKRLAVYCPATASIYEAEPMFVELLVPKDNLLTTPGLNPWKQLLEQQQGQAPR